MMPSLESTTTMTRAPTKASCNQRSAHQPYLLEYSMMAEYRLLQEQRLPGVYVIPSANSQLVWFGVLFIRGGCYEGGVFKFTVFIPEDYPDADCPRVVFDVPIFHPLIDPVSGELDCRRSFQKWRRNVNHIWQLILYARRVFYKLDTKPNPNNPEAAVLFEENYDLYQTRVRESLQACRERLYERPKIEDDHAIRFCEMDTVTFRDTKNKMICPQRPSPDSSLKGSPLDGLSWMYPGSSQMFDREKPE